MKDPVKVKRGEKARRNGGEFERRVRKDLEEKGWIVDKWSNNIKITDGFEGPRIPENEWSIILAKHRMGKNGRILCLGTGFPDFIAFKNVKVIDDFEAHSFSMGNDFGIDYEIKNSHFEYQIIGVEAKMNGILSKVEKESCQWYLDKGVFSKILIAEKTKLKGRVVIKYHDFVEKYG